MVRSKERLEVIPNAYLEEAAVSCYLVSDPLYNFHIKNAI